MCIRDSSRDLVEELAEVYEKGDGLVPLCGSLISVPSGIPIIAHLEDYLAMCIACLLYTSDAADERSSVDLGGRRIIKKKTTKDL